MAKKETGRDGFQSELIKDIQSLYPESIIMKNDPNYIQGIPDITVLCGDKWALLECKRSEEEYLKESGKRPNQEYYIKKANAMSFGRFVYPENKKEVLDDLSKTFNN